MDILFVLVAVCPAAIVSKYELKEKFRWETFCTKFAGWFYLITFANFLLLYLDGWGSFDFTAVSVQFLLRYMVNSAILIAVAGLGKWAVRHIGEGGRDV